MRPKLVFGHFQMSRDSQPNLSSALHDTFHTGVSVKGTMMRPTELCQIVKHLLAVNSPEHKPIRLCSGSQKPSNPADHCNAFITPAAAGAASSIC